MGRDGGHAAGRVVGRRADPVGLGSRVAEVAGDHRDGGVCGVRGREGGGRVAGEGMEDQV